MVQGKRLPPREMRRAKAEAVEMVRGGSTRAAAALACRINYCTVTAACDAAGMPRASQCRQTKIEWTAAMDAWLRANHTRLAEPGHVRKGVGVSESAARNRANLLGLPPTLPEPKTGMAAPAANELAAARLLAERGRATAEGLAEVMGEQFAWDAELALRRSKLFEADGRLWSLSGWGWAALRDAKGAADEPAGTEFPPSARNGKFPQARRPAHRAEAS